MEYRCGTNAIVFHKDSVLLLKSRKGEWQFPGGTFEPAVDSSMEQCCSRELFEETGIVVKSTRIEPVYAVTSLDAAKRIGHCAAFSEYYFQANTAELSVTLDDSSTEYVWSKLHEAEVLLGSSSVHATALFLTQLD